MKHFIRKEACYYHSQVTRWKVNTAYCNSSKTNKIYSPLHTTRHRHISSWSTSLSQKCATPTPVRPLFSIHVHRYCNWQPFQSRGNTLVFTRQHCTKLMLIKAPFIDLEVYILFERLYDVYKKMERITKPKKLSVGTKYGSWSKKQDDKSNNMA